MPTQFMMAILFCTCDGILNFQNIYYKYWSIPRRLKAQQLLEQQQQAAITSESQALLVSDGQGKDTLASPSGSRSDPEASPVKPVMDGNGGETGVPAAHHLRSISAGEQTCSVHLSECM